MATYSPGETSDFDAATPLDTDQDVLRRVDRLIDQDSRRRRSVWLFFLSGDGVQLPAVVPIDDVPTRPKPYQVGNLCDIIAQVLSDAAPDGSAVISLTRPGDSTVADTDRYWFHLLHDSARERGVSIRLLCLATQDAVRQLTLDDAI